MKIHITGHKGYVGSHLTNISPYCPHTHEKSGNEIVGVDISEHPVEENHNRIMGLCRMPSDAFVHLAAKISVAESFEKPADYVDANLTLLNTILKNVNTKNFIFISSASVLEPNNPYSMTKLLGEKMVEKSGVPYTILRPSNIAGCAFGLEDKVSTNHIIGKFCLALKNEQPLEIYGSDYPTRDGTCIRNYVSVKDVCYKINKCILDGPKYETFYAIGKGHYTNLEIADMVMRREKFNDVKIKFLPRRKNDVADYKLERIPEPISAQPIDFIIDSVYNAINGHVTEEAF